MMGLRLMHAILSYIQHWGTYLAGYVSPRDPYANAV